MLEASVTKYLINSMSFIDPFDACSPQTPLHLAAITKQPHAVDSLIKAGANPRLRDRHGNTAVHIACAYGDAACLKALLKYNVAKIALNWQNYQGRSCLKCAYDNCVDCRMLYQCPFMFC